MLYEHQLKIITDNRKKTGIFLGTGSGKTLIALSLARGKTLIIAPKTQVEDKNWERENIKSNLNVDITVISKEAFKKEHESLKNFETIIIDEAHTCLGVTPNIRYRNKKPEPKTSQLFLDINNYIKKNSPDRLYLITATPIRSPMTVWGASELLGFNWNWYEFRNTFYTNIKIPNRDIWVPKNTDEAKNRLARAVNLLGYTGKLQDYLDVPDQTYRTDSLELTKEQINTLKDIQLEYPDPIVLVGKKHQIENGVLSKDEYSNNIRLKNKKIDAILNYCYEFSKIIVFVKYIAQIEYIYDELKKEGINVYKMTGSTKDRGELLNKLSKSDNYVFLVQSQISSGWELPECRVIIFASMSYSIVDRIQGEGRILRANNLKKNLFISLIAKGGVDEAVYKSINNKKDFSERIYAERS